MINSKDYLRQVGISEEQFTVLLNRLKQEIEKDLQNKLNEYKYKKDRIIQFPQFKKNYYSSSRLNKKTFLI